jgi:hypothetical protein
MKNKPDPALLGTSYLSKQKNKEKDTEISWDYPFKPYFSTNAIFESIELMTYLERIPQSRLPSTRVAESELEPQGAASFCLRLWWLHIQSLCLT